MDAAAILAALKDHLVIEAERARHERDQLKAQYEKEQQKYEVYYGLLDRITRMEVEPGPT